MHFKKSIVVAAATAAPGLATYTKDYKVNTYFGQANNYAGDVDTLGQYCKSASIDYITLAFVNNSRSMVWASPEPTSVPTVLPPSTPPGASKKPSKLLTGCNFIKDDIKLCQNLGKKVYLSIGGEMNAASNYAISSVKAGEDFAQQMFDIFGPYNKNYKGPRPFGELAMDGFDFDIEVKFPNQDPYVAMVDKLRCLIRDNKAGIILSASPQCPMDTAHFQMDSILAKAQFDKLFIQFYNNPACAATNPLNFNFNKWIQYISNKPSKNAELYIGLPGSTKAASSGYLNPTEVKDLICDYKHSKNFGGVSLFDAYYAYHNEDCEGETYYDVVKKALTCGGCKGDICAPKLTTTTSATLPTSSLPAVTSATSSAAVITSSSSADVVSTTSSSDADSTTITASASVTDSASATQSASSTSSDEEEDCTDEPTASQSATASASASITSMTSDLPTITASASVSASASTTEEEDCTDDVSATQSASASASATASFSASATTESDSYSVSATDFSASATDSATESFSASATDFSASATDSGSATASSTDDMPLPTPVATDSATFSASASGSASISATASASGSSTDDMPLSTPVATETGSDNGPSGSASTSGSVSATGPASASATASGSTTASSTDDMPLPTPVATETGSDNGPSGSASASGSITGPASGSGSASATNTAASTDWC
ncbi:hypothetical protein PG994_010435 [Apiospora phragmitis]|uniref:chitinase n=1 Tax=Apiospora phragmitis TaxID=2905665 RepID=A0ABR1TPW5_9PEZI